jgi:hypothetical protein
MRLGDPEVGQQVGGCLGLHGSAAIGVQRQLTGWDGMLGEGVIKKFLEQDGVFSIGDALVPTIAEARVVIRSGDESDSPGDSDCSDHRGAARA